MWQNERWNTVLKCDSGWLALICINYPENSFASGVIEIQSTDIWFCFPHFHIKLHSKEYTHTFIKRHRPDLWSRIHKLTIFCVTKNTYWDCRSATFFHLIRQNFNECKNKFIIGKFEIWHISFKNKIYNFTLYFIYHFMLILILNKYSCVLFTL